MHRWRYLNNWQFWHTFLETSPSNHVCHGVPQSLQVNMLATSSLVFSHLVSSSRFISRCVISALHTASLNNFWANIFISYNFMMTQSYFIYLILLLFQINCDVCLKELPTMKMSKTFFSVFRMWYFWLLI